MNNPTHTLRLLTANIQAGSSTRRYSDYVTRSWSHALPMGRKRNSLDAIAQLTREHDIVGLQEADPGSLRSGFTNQTHYLAQRAGFNYWSHQPNRRLAGIAASANGLLSRDEPDEVVDYALPSRIPGRGALLVRYGDGADSLTLAIAHLSLSPKARSAQLAFLGELLSGPGHKVLMGDFNCDPDRPEMQALYRNTRLQLPANCVPTFPSWKPQRAIDHVLVTPALQVAAMQALPAAQSDHLALSVELDVPEHAFE